MIQVIPAIDLIGGRCVRLSQGDYDRQTSYGADPVDMVRRFVDAGLSRIHAVDLDGAKAQGPANLRMLEKMASLAGAAIEWGGGLKSDEAIRAARDAGARWCVAGSVAIENPELFASWLDRYGPDVMVLGADCRKGLVATRGWLEQSDVTVQQLLGRFPGVSQCIVTDIARDGMLEGPNLDLYQMLQTELPKVTFTVSGGVSTIDDIIRAQRLGLRRIIVGKAIYEGRIKLSDLQCLPKE